MAYLLLPSSRLALFMTENHQIRVLPIRAEDYLRRTVEGNQLLAVSYLKTLSLYSSEIFEKAENANQIQALSSVQFTKKLEGLTANSKGIFYVSDKFGDIYSIINKCEQKYMNSNLGIPTFLEHINFKNRSYMIVGDEDTRIKVYN